ncbi:MAG TPA: hypothetical protein VFB13_21290 [Reyranella sp.]|jgi:hypothetical protein|nr:hypothetical protein [Reyranella sp.]
MTAIRFVVPLAVAAMLAAAPSFAQTTKAQEESQEKTIQLSQVPKAARDAGQKALGAAPTEAKIVNGTNPQEYELEAKAANGKETSVHVRADGTVVKKESE